jgi:hypothetical protein
MMLNQECDQNKSVNTSSASTNSEKMSDLTQEYSKVWYEATTRGFYEKIWVTKDSITITADRNQMVSTSYLTLEEDWNELMNLLKTVNVSELPDLEAPTSMRHYDGAAIATLAVSMGKTEIKSNNFDHGHPPKAIEAVVNKVLSMKEMHEKN